MNRRQFLRYSATWGASLALGNLVSSCAQTPVKITPDETLLEGLRIIDAHAHPDQFHSYRPTPDRSILRLLRPSKQSRMAASSFSAVGDS